MTSQRAKFVSQALSENTEFGREAGVDMSSALPRPIAAEAYRRFIKIRDASSDDPNCLDREDEFINYEYENRPSQREAEALCAGCPFFVPCRTYARNDRPGHGVWGGRDYSRPDLPDNPEETA